MRIFIVGGDSTIGSCLSTHYENSPVEVISTTRRASTRKSMLELDLATEPDSWDLPKADVTILCAAVTNLQKCRNEPKLSYRINVLNSSALIAKQNAASLRCIVLSTNLVFDGSEARMRASQPYTGQELYGAQKAALEKAALQSPLNTVIRLGKVLTSEQQLIAQWKKNLANGEPVEAFEDYYFSPVSLRFAVDVIAAVAEKKKAPIVQATAERTVSYADFAEHFVQALGFPRSRVKRTKLPMEMRSATVPRFTDLDGSMLRQYGLIQPTPFQCIPSLL